MAEPLPIQCQSANPVPIGQSGANRPIRCQSGANPSPLVSLVPLVLDWQKLDHIGYPVGDLLLIEMVPDWPELARTDNMVSFEGQLTLYWQWIGTCPGLDEIGIES